MLVWDDNNPPERLKVYDRGINVEGAERNEALITYRHGEIHTPVLDNREALQMLVQDFADTIQGRGRPLADGAAGLRVLRLLEATDRSIAEGGVRVDL